jgi:prefoldin subunit 5
MGRMMQTFDQLAEENKMLKTSLKVLEQEIAEMRRMMAGHTKACAHEH